MSRTSFDRKTMLCAASALTLSVGAAMADDTTEIEGAAGAQAQTLVEVGQRDTVAVNANGIGTAAQHLAGMSAGEIEGMEVFDQYESRVGVVEMVAQNDHGGVFLIVTADESSSMMMPGRHAVPLPRFDYDAEANALVMSDDYASATAATADPYGATSARLYTVLDAEAEVPAVTADLYMVDPAEPVDEQVALEGRFSTQPAEEAVHERSVEYIVGLDILDRNREDIGDVEEVAHNAKDELFLIVSLDDGILGIGDSERAVKLDLFDYSPADEALVLMDTSEAVLEALPEYDSDTPGYTVIESDLDWARFK